MKTETEQEVVKKEEVSEIPAGTEQQQVTRTVAEHRDESAIYRTIQNVIYYIAGIIMILLGFRFAFLWAGANPESGFVSFIYSVSRPFVSPFLYIFSNVPSEGAETTGYFEPASLVAIAVYAVAAWLLVKLISIIFLSRKA